MRKRTSRCQETFSINQGPSLHKWREAIVWAVENTNPEYTGFARSAILKRKPEGSRAEVYQRVKDEYEKRLGLTLGSSVGFNDTFATNSQGRIIECGAIASLLVGHWKQARRKWSVQLDRQRGHVSLSKFLLGHASTVRVGSPLDTISSGHMTRRSW